MNAAELPLRLGTIADVPAIHALVERGYRDSSVGGWTSEADLFDGARTDAASLVAIIADPQQEMLVAADDAGVFACVVIARKGSDSAYLGLLCVDPDRQAAGIGRRLIAAAEREAARRFGATRVEMTVIDCRDELIAYYGRRGYVPTGEVRALPDGAGATRIPVALCVLARSIVAATA